MYPTFAQIRDAAYHRWLRRGARHGRDREDWIAAEQGAFFALNYDLLAHHFLDETGPGLLPTSGRLRCRFCERSPDEVDFSGPAPAVPESLGNMSLRTREECDECREAFDSSLDRDLARFAGFYRGGMAEGSVGRFRPIAAFKGLVRSALLILPHRELDVFPDAVEWLANPDHALDLGSLGALDCVVSLLEEPAASPWAALARRRDDDAELPYLLAFFGVDRVVFEIALPFCSRDEELDGGRIVFPRVATPTDEVIDVAATLVIPMASEVAI